MSPFPKIVSHPQATTSGYRERKGLSGQGWESKEAWTELVFTVDDMLLARISSNSVYAGFGGPFHRDAATVNIKVRCETNIYTLYRGAVEKELEVLEAPWPYNGVSAKVSPTTDLRGSNNPDNSALTGSSLAWGGNCYQHWVVRILILSLVVVLLS